MPESVAVRYMSDELADQIVSCTFGHFSPDVVESAKDAIVDQLGCQLLGSTLEWTQPAFRMVRGFGASPESTIVNFGTKSVADAVAYVNSVFGQGAELDDYGGGRGAHSGAVCVSAAMALAEREASSSREVLTAIIAGYDTAWALGTLLHKSVYARGFHAHAIISVFAATAVAGKLLDLSSEELAHAFAIAGSHASGTMEYDQTGGEVKRLHSGLAVRGGIQSAMLAKDGLTGPRSIFEGRRGIMASFGGEEHPESLRLDYETGVGMERNCFKLFPTNASQQSSLHLSRQLTRDRCLTSDEITAIDVWLNPGAVIHCGSVYHPQESVQAQFSLPFSLALSVTRGSNALSLYRDETLWNDPGIRDVSDKVHLHPDDALVDDRRYACRMRLTLADGEIREAESEYPKGSFRDPLAPEEVHAKFRELAEPILTRPRADLILDSVRSFEDWKPSDIVKLLVA